MFLISLEAFGTLPMLGPPKLAPDLLPPRLEPFSFLPLSAG